MGWCWDPLDVSVVGTLTWNCHEMAVWLLLTNEALAVRSFLYVCTCPAGAPSRTELPQPEAKKVWWGLSVRAWLCVMVFPPCGYSAAVVL